MLEYSNIRKLEDWDIEILRVLGYWNTGVLGYWDIENIGVSTLAGGFSGSSVFSDVFFMVGIARAPYPALSSGNAASEFSKSCTLKQKHSAGMLEMPPVWFKSSLLRMGWLGWAGWLRWLAWLAGLAGLPGCAGWAGWAGLAAWAGWAGLPGLGWPAGCARRDGRELQAQQGSLRRIRLASLSERLTVTITRCRSSKSFKNIVH